LIAGLLFVLPSGGGSAQKTGHILWVVAGGCALLGIPIAIAGAHKVDRRPRGAAGREQDRDEQDRDAAYLGAIPQIDVGIMSSTFTWSF
jgi:hypothetical protein